MLKGNILYAPNLVERFKTEKGYDPAPWLVGLFHDIGDFTDKIRCDYYEVMSAALEENFYKPLCVWHEERGMRYGTIATWGRQDMLGQTWHYGDFFRLMRWFHVTGNEDPEASLPGQRCFIDAKLSSSILHIYERERASMCVYWGSGWGMTQEQNVAWTNENYAYGLNLYNQHGGLYNTLGGWYEWVPPSIPLAPALLGALADVRGLCVAFERGDEPGNARGGCGAALPADDCTRQLVAGGFVHERGRRVRDVHLCARPPDL